MRATRSAKSPVKQAPKPESPTKKQAKDTSLVSGLNESQSQFKYTTAKQIDVDHLQETITIMQNKVDVSEDLERQVQELQKQLQASQATNAQLAANLT